jgi:hypothetical protein
MFEHSIRCTQLEEPVVEQILLQLENHELRILSRKYLRPDFPIDSEIIAKRLSMNANFTLLTKLTLNYDTY